MMEANMPRSLRIGDAAPNFTARTTQGEIALDGSVAKIGGSQR